MTIPSAVSAVRRCPGPALVAGLFVFALAPPTPAQVTRPAETLPAQTRPAPPAGDLARFRPTEQELRSPSFWVERALEVAEQIDDPRHRAVALWAAGVTAFDIGRFDITRRVMARPDLDNQHQGTLAYRLVAAFALAGDTDRILEVAGTLQPGYARDSIYQQVAEGYAKQGDLAAAVRMVDEKVTPGLTRNDNYLCLARTAIERGDLATAWSLAEKVAADGDSSESPSGFLLYIRAAAEAERGIRQALATGAGWKSEEMRDDLLQRLADILADSGLSDQAKAYAARVRNPAPKRPPDHWLEAFGQAEAGRFDEAKRIAETESDLHLRAIAWAEIARLQAMAGTVPAEEVGRTLARARAVMDEAVKATEALAQVPPEKRRPWQLLDVSDDPAGVSDSVSEYITHAEAARGDLPAMLATLETITRVELRWSYLRRAMSAKAKAGDVAFLQGVLAADIPWMPMDGLEDVLMNLAEAQVTAKAFRGAEATADRIRAVSRRVTVLVDVARGLAQAGDVSAARRVLNRADEAAKGNTDRFGPTPAERAAQLQARLLQPEAVWAKAVREPDPHRRAGLLLAAAEGLLARQLGAPFRE